MSEIRLVRHDSGLTPWGFRITGGRDFGTPLLVVKVVGGSIAALAGVQVGDIIRGINNDPTNDFTHLDAQRAILESGDTLVLNLLKGGDYEQPGPPSTQTPRPPPVPVIPVIDIQSPEDKEVEEIDQQDNDELELSFVVLLDESGRVSAVEEIPTPSTTPRATPASRRTSSSRRSSSGSGGKRRKSSGSLSRSGKTPTDEGSEKKPILSVSFNDNGPINIQPPSYEDATRCKSEEKKENSKHKEVTPHEEMKMETSIQKTAPEVTEKTEEEFVIGVREEIIGRAHNEKRELTEEEIAEMMAGEAEVIEAIKGKEVIGVNFQKFMPKCDFIKESEVFKVLQEEQIKKSKSEEEQLEKEPLKRFSKFLIKPKTAKPIPKPKTVHSEILPWQQKLNSPDLPDKKRANTESTTSNKQTNEVDKESLITEQEVIKETTLTDQHKEKRESITGSTVQENEEDLTIKYQEHEKQEFKEVIEKREEDIKDVEEFNVEEELESIDWKKEEKEQRKESDERSPHKRSSLEEGRRSKLKKVAFAGLQCKEDIEKQLAEIQKELLTLQRLPIEIQNHLVMVQQSLQDILAERSQIQTPENDNEKVKATEIFTYNPDGDEEAGELSTKDEDKVKGYKNRGGKELLDETSDKEISISKSTTSTVEESPTVSSTKAEQNSAEFLSFHTEANTEENNQIKENDAVKETEVVTNEKEEEKHLPHGQEDVEISKSNGKPALPLTPQIRPLVLPGGRKWVQPRDAYTEEFIAETLVSQSEVIVGTTIGVNFQKYVPPKFDTSNSAVYRMVHDIEEKTKKGVAERPEKVHGLDEFYHPPVSC